MKILAAYALAALGLGGGAILAHARSAGGTGGAAACGSCVGTTCKSGNVDSTCTSGIDGTYRWCSSSSGCARRTSLGWCAPPVPL